MLFPDLGGDPPFVLAGDPDCKAHGHEVEGPTIRKYSAVFNFTKICRRSDYYYYSVSIHLFENVPIRRDSIR